jgi:hypothetical protein
MPELLFKAVPFVVGSILAVVLARGLWNFWMRGESRRWPSVRGKVRSAQIVRGLSPRDEDGQRDEYFDVEVEYEYRVRGKEYVSTRYSFDTGHYLRYDDAMSALRGIAAGREVAVYYDPLRPERAVLRRG